MPAYTTFQELIQALDLQAHPEGGYYKEHYRSDENITIEREAGVQTRSLMTSIHYALERGDFSSFHRLQSDELWYFHQGAPVHLMQLTRTGAQTVIMGAPGQGVLECCIPKGTWFAATPDPGAKERYSLVSCVVSPGFAFEDFELAARDRLCSEFPDCHELVCAYTRA